MPSPSYPAAYIRRSHVDQNSPGDVSREAQEAAVRELAQRDGHNGDLRLYVDWGLSADYAKEAKRTEFLRLLTDMESGEVSAVYAYALDRLYRSTRTFYRLTDAAKRHGVRIVTQRDGVLGGDGSPMSQAFAQITAVFAELELNTAKARTHGVMQRRRARGDHMGHPAFGWRHTRSEAGAILHVPDPSSEAQTVIAAYHQSVSLQATCRLLNDRDSGYYVRSPRGTLWRPPTLSSVLRLHGVGLPPAAPNGRHEPIGKAAMFSKLLWCPCGGMMSPNRHRAQYYCPKASFIGGQPHQRAYVAEKYLVPAIADEVARIEWPATVELFEASPEMEALNERERRLHKVYANGGMADVEYERSLTALREQREALDSRPRIVEVPQGFEWDAPAALINATLRGVFDKIELGRDLLPSAFIWRFPDWRRAD